MGRSRHHPRNPRTLVLAVVTTILAASCGGDEPQEAAASGNVGALGDHANHANHAGHADHLAGAVEGGEIDVAARCDLGFNTARFNDTATLVHHQEGHGDMGDVDFTLEEWADVFVDEELGLSAAEVLDALGPDDIYRRHVLGGVLTHTLDPDPWMPMTDPAECDALSGELQAAREVTTRYPTVADALAAGYTLGDRYFAGLGVHYQNWDLLGAPGAFDPGRPVQLLYDGTDDDATLVGLSYVVALPGDVPPEGFTGDNDQWHRHRSYCLDLDDGGVNLSSDVLSPQECAAVGGTFVPNTDGWMLHVWVAPGCESDWGMFSGANTRLPYIPEGAPFASGCNSGKDLAGPLDLDDRGTGPDVT